MKYFPVDYSSSIIKDYVSNFEYGFDIVKSLHLIIDSLIQSLDKTCFIEKENRVFIHKGASVSESATIVGPCVIYDGVKVLPNAYIRENVILEKNSFIGHSVEIKNSLVMENAVVAHFNYVGDSILGKYTHLGAGAIISNFRLDHEIINVDGLSTGTDKLGAIIGEYTEIGANAVINPGSIIYSNKKIYPLTSIKGIVK